MESKVYIVRVNYGLYDRYHALLGNSNEWTTVPFIEDSVILVDRIEADNIMEDARRKWGRGATVINCIREGSTIKPQAEFDGTSLRKTHEQQFKVKGA